MKNPIFNIHDLILLLTLAVCILLVLFQLILSRQKTIASHLLCSFFVCVGANALCNLLLWSEYIQLQTPTFKFILAYGLAIADVGKGIFLYFYVVAITLTNFRASRKCMLHLLPFIAVIVLLLSARINSETLRFASPNLTEFRETTTRMLWYLLKVLPVFYAIAAFLVAKRYKLRLQNFYSNLHLQGPEGLLLLTGGFAVSWSWSLLVHIFGELFGPDFADDLGIADNYITFILVNALFLYSLRYAHELIETKNPVTEKEPPLLVPPNQVIIDKIKYAMDVDQLYLKHNLNIEAFAKHLGINYREVSNIINTHFGTNFFEFVNAYRVDKAKEMLLEPAFAEKTILFILLECGFNSKSAFHRFFKRYAGVSAAEFRKHHTTSHPKEESHKDV